MSEFDLCCKFFKRFGCNGSCTWTVDGRKLIIVFYFNDENMHLTLMTEWLNVSAEKFNLQRNGWNLLFQMICSRIEAWINDFYKKSRVYVV